MTCKQHILCASSTFGCWGWATRLTISCYTLTTVCSQFRDIKDRTNRRHSRLICIAVSWAASSDCAPHGSIINWLLRLVVRVYFVHSCLPCLPLSAPPPSGSGLGETKHMHYNRSMVSFMHTTRSIYLGHTRSMRTIVWTNFNAHRPKPDTSPYYHLKACISSFTYDKI